MNLLAHLFLTRDRPVAEQLGNFSADHVGGRRAVAAYPEGFQRGVALHHRIDGFTDAHPVVQQTKARLREAGFGKYAPVVADVFYDHLLARDFTRYSPAETLPAFTQRTYGLLQRHADELPPGVRAFVPHMVQHDWLTNYGTLPGITRSLTGLSRRASPGSRLETAPAELVRHLPLYAAEFAAFFPALQAELAR